MSERVLGHWLWTAALILVVSALAIRQIDLHPPDPDSFHTLMVSGWLTEGSWTPADVAASLQAFTPEQMPLYFVLLNLWGNLVGHELAMARVLSIFCGILACAVIMRAASEQLAPSAGFFAAILVISNAFFNMYLAYARPYAMLALAASLTLWLYLRLIARKQPPRRIEFAALVLAGAALVSIHAFGLLLCLALGIYHLLFARKDKSWLLAALAAVAALVIASPWLLGFFEASAQLAVTAFAPGAATMPELYSAWIAIIANGSPLLLAASVVIALAGWRRGLIAGKPVLPLFACLALSIGLAALLAQSINTQHARYLLAGYPIAALFFAAALHALFRYRWWLAALAIVWVANGLAYQRSEAWWQTIMLRSQVFDQPPTQTISRLARQSDIKPAIIGFPYDSFYPGYLTFSGKLGVGSLPIAQRDHFFARHGIDMQTARSLDEFRERAQYDSLRKPLVWHFHAHSEDDALIAQAQTALERLGYLHCGETRVGVDTVIRQLRWRELGCETPAALSRHRTDALQYEFFAAGIDDAAKELAFVDRWQSLVDKFPRDLRISWQLIDSDWQNVAQLDLPLTQEGALRRFSIDIADAPAGDYRLVAIVYNAETGERQAWHDNDGWIPEMQELATILIPKPASDSP